MSKRFTVLLAAASRNKTNLSYLKINYATKTDVLKGSVKA